MRLSEHGGKSNKVGTFLYLKSVGAEKAIFFIFFFLFPLPFRACVCVCAVTAFKLFRDGVSKFVRGSLGFQVWAAAVREVREGHWAAFYGEFLTALRSLRGCVCVAG